MAAMLGVTPQISDNDPEDMVGALEVVASGGDDLEGPHNEGGIARAEVITEGSSSADMGRRLEGLSAPRQGGTVQHTFKPEGILA
eukprot:3234978-Heterocapsa_arctica.AAC.1